MENDIRLTRSGCCSIIVGDDAVFTIKSPEVSHHIIHASVAYLNGVCVANFMEREGHSNDGQKLLGSRFLLKMFYIQGVDVRAVVDLSYVIVLIIIH